jgi:hypothetical protein
MEGAQDLDLNPHKIYNELLDKNKEKDPGEKRHCLVFDHYPWRCGRTFSLPSVMLNPWCMSCLQIV